MSSKNKNQHQRAYFLSEIISLPEQNIYTFGETDFLYFIISKEGDDLVSLRKGRLVCGKPAIITPETLQRTMQGFLPEAVDYIKNHYPDLLSKIRMLGYQISSELFSEEKLHQSEGQVIENIKTVHKNQLIKTGIGRSPNDLWNTTALKIGVEVIKRSVPGNIRDLEERGYFLSDDEKIRNEIEILFEEAAINRAYFKDLGDLLQSSGLFEEYEDRFFALVNQK